MSNPEKKVNLLQLAEWLTKATSNNNNFLLKPTDLSMLYTIVLWEYISNHPDSGDGSKPVPDISNDKQISIPEKDLIRIVQLFYNNTFYPYFNRLKHM